MLNIYLPSQQVIPFVAVQLLMIALSLTAMVSVSPKVHAVVAIAAAFNMFGAIFGLQANIDVANSNE